MNPNTVAVFACTRGKKENTLLYKEWSISGVSLHIKENNTEGLALSYNKFLKDHHTEYEIICFVHDDIQFLQDDLENKLIQAHAEYDIVGLAGCINPRIQAPALWHLMCGGFQSGNTRGAVAHVVSEGKYYVSSFGVTPDRVVMVDGVFMSVKVKTCMSAGWQFNENYDFHHYDISSCLDANQLKLKIGVWPIFICHNSPGLSNLNDTVFRRNQAKFLQEYGKL
jgi:hypothetical protein